MFSFQTLIQNPFDIHFEFGKHLERQGTVCIQRMILLHLHATPVLKFGIAAYMGFQGDTIIVLVPLLPQQKGGDHITSSLAFCPCPHFRSKPQRNGLTTNFFPIRIVQDRISLCRKQDYCSTHTLQFSTCGFLLQTTTKKSLSKKIGFERTKGLDVYHSECPSFSSARKPVMLSFHIQCKTSWVWWHSHVILQLV